MLKAGRKSGLLFLPSHSDLYMVDKTINASFKAFAATIGYPVTKAGRNTDHSLLYEVDWGRKKNQTLTA